MQNSSLLLNHHTDPHRTSSQTATTANGNNCCLDSCMFLSEDGRQYSEKAFIYDRGILIPKSTDTSSTMVSAILIFNCALAHHLCAETLFKGPSQQQCLLNAKCMYELAHEVHPVEKNFLFHFAVVNNIAMIEAKIGNTETSTKILEYLMTVLMLFIDQGHTERLRLLQGFLASVILKSDNAAAA